MMPIYMYTTFVILAYASSSVNKNVIFCLKGARTDTRILGASDTYPLSLCNCDMLLSQFQAVQCASSHGQNIESLAKHCLEIGKSTAISARCITLFVQATSASSGAAICVRSVFCF